MTEWINPKQQLPPPFEEVRIKVKLKDKMHNEFYTERNAVFMEGSWYSVDLQHCIEHKIEEWRMI
jgi:hypothetical protein